MAPRTGPLPANIARFKIEALLGSGGMGEVYKAFDPTLKRTVAVKTVRGDISNPEYLERLYREAQACAHLQHPNIVTVHEAGEADGVVYLVMEFLQGQDLATVLRTGTLSVWERLQILMSVLEALEHAHNQGVVHRDIKPSNIQRLPDGSIKVVDFGLARMAVAETMTVSGSIMGTPHYASPEQLRGHLVDNRSDIYSIGAVAYEMLSGHRPFESAEDDSVATIITKVLTEPPPPMSGEWVSAIPEIEPIVSRAMAKNAADRFQSAADMHTAFAALASSDAVLRSAETVVMNPVGGPIGGSRGSVTPPRLVPTPVRPPEGTTVTDNRAPSPADTTRTGGKIVQQQVPPSGVAAPRRSGTLLWVLGVAAAVVIAVIALPNVMGGGAETPAAQPAGTAGTTTGSTTTPSNGPAENGAANTSTGTPAELNTTPGLAGAPPPPPVRLADSTPRGTTVASESSSSSSGRGSAASGGTSAAQPARASAETSTASASAPELGAKALFYGDAVAAAAGKPGTSPAKNVGLQYRLIQSMPAGGTRDVDPAATFHEGDLVRLVFESNIDGYLYVIAQGSSGQWKYLFPAPEINRGMNRIEKFKPYEVPRDDWFYFDEKTGTENLFVFLSAEPLKELPGFSRGVTETDSLPAPKVDELKTRIASRDLWLMKDRPARGQGSPTQVTYVVNHEELGKAVSATIQLNHSR